MGFSLWLLACYSYSMSVISILNNFPCVRSRWAYKAAQCTLWQLSCKRRKRFCGGRESWSRPESSWLKFDTLKRTRSRNCRTTRIRRGILSAGRVRSHLLNTSSRIKSDLYFWRTKDFRLWMIWWKEYFVCYDINYIYNELW